MKKSIIISIASLAIMAILVVAMVFNFHFSIMSMSRSFASADGFDADYTTMLEELNEFAENGDYQKWLVTSGGTYFGKFVRIVVMVLEPVLFFLSGWFFFGNVSYIRRKITKKLRRKSRKAC